MRFEVTAPAEIPVTDCNCSMCRKTGYLHLLVEKSRFRLLQGENALATYTFNKHAIKHKFCATCGIHPLAVAEDPSGKPMAAINVRCLEGVDLSSLAVKHFDGRSL